MTHNGATMTLGLILLSAALLSFPPAVGGPVTAPSVLAVQAGTQSGLANGTAVKLAVFPTPQALLPQTSSTGEVFVQLQDANGNPALAPSPIVVTLASSRPAIANVTGLITIPQGGTYGTAISSALFSTGTTTITASSTGLATGSASLKVVGPPLSKLSVVVAPGLLPAGSLDQAIVDVQLQGVDGTPAPAPAPIVVVVTSSNTSVGRIVTPRITIPLGKSFGASSLIPGVPGNTIVTAIAQGYASGTFLATVKAASLRSQGNLSLYLGTPSILNDHSDYRTVAVQLQSNGSGVQGVPVLATRDVIVYFSSSITSVGTVPIGSVPANVTIYSGRSFATTTLTSSLAVGHTVITAAASNFTSDFKNVTSAGPIPSKLAVIPGLAQTIADGGTYLTTAVQLQDAQGNPATTPVDLIVTLASSSPNVGTVDQAVVISSGKSHAFFQFVAGSTAGSTNITASTSGYVPGQGKLVTINLPMSGVITAGTLSPSSLTAVKFVLNLTSGNSPLAGASVQWPANSKQISIVNSTTATDSAGSSYAYVLFQDSGNLTVSAIAQKTGYGQQTFTLKVAVKPQTITILLIPTNTILNESQPTGIIAQVTGRGKPLANVAISWSTDIGAVNPPSSTTDATGTSMATFVSPTNGTANVKASVSVAGYAAASQTTQITINLAGVSSGGGGGGGSAGAGGIVGLLTGNLIYIVVALVVVLVLVVVLRRRGKKGKAKGAAKGGGKEAADAEQGEEQ